MSAAQTYQVAGESTLTLGELLYAHPTIALVSEKQWLAEVHAIAAGDKAALRMLYERALPIVFTYLMRLTRDRYLTDSVILEVFETVWCEAPVFDKADGPVLGWIMRQGRSLALTRAGGGKSSSSDSEPIPVGTSADPIATGDSGDQFSAGSLLQSAIEALTMDERQAMEGTFLHGLSYAELAAQNGESIGIIKTRIRSGLAKLQDALHARGEER